QQDAGTSSVDVRLSFYEGDTLRFVLPPPGARITCNGVSLVPSPICPRQPAGGTYQIAYTDEHGVVSTVVVPVPQGSLAILSPSPGGMAKIPKDGLLSIHFSAPLIPPGGAFTVEHVAAWCGGALPQPGPCQGVSVVPQNQASPAIFGAVSQPGVASGAGPLAAFSAATPAPPATPTPPAASPTPGATPTPGILPTPTFPAAFVSSATVTLSGGEGAILVRSDFSSWAPGPGQIRLSVSVQVKPAPGGFADASAIFSDDLSTSVTWTRG
ncbi:MAG TPA: hypothetical protein VF807_09115, partial [Ktedonobacterales bacterium]